MSVGRSARAESDAVKAINDAYYRFEMALTSMQSVWRNGHTTEAASLVIDELVEERDALRHELVALRRAEQ